MIAADSAGVETDASRDGAGASLEPCDGAADTAETMSPAEPDGAEVGAAETDAPEAPDSAAEGMAGAEPEVCGTSSDPDEAVADAAVGVGVTALLPAGGGSDGAGWR